MSKSLVGSRLRIRGKVDQPIRSAVMQSSTPDLPLPAVEIAGDGRRFTVPAGPDSWTVERSGSFSFELSDQHGMKFGRDSRMELHAVPDAALDRVGDTERSSFCHRSCIGRY